MLNDEKKALIEAEERYRHAIASKLRSEIGVVGHEIQEVEQGIWGKIQELLNSNVGTWFLSTVLVTGGAAVYQTMQHHYEAKLHNKTELITYQFEIGNRIENMKYFLRKTKTVGDAQFALNSVFKSKTPINPEVQNINLSVLYFNFFQLNGHQNKEALATVRELEDAEYDLQSQKPSNPLSSEDKEKLLVMVNTLEKMQIQEAADNN